MLDGPQSLGLSPRQQQVLELLGDGLTNKEIGVALGITTETAKTHVSGVIRKLGLPGRRDAGRLYRQFTRFGE